MNKYINELHANEIVLLAYYIAAVNIENAYHAVFHAAGYQPFEGICLTDTFELYERGQQTLELAGVMKENSKRVNEQKSTRIEVIVGNPPYSVGQKSANDNAQNRNYDNLEARIAATYAKFTDATNKNSLYDSYIKAFRWATDRIGDGGVIGFVTNAGWLDGSAMDGLRKCFAKDFSAIYVFNLRGNQRTQGETSRREGGKIFGSGSRAPIAITILVKTPDHVGDAEIFYRDIGDYLTRDEKLSIVEGTHDVLNGGFTQIFPNERCDWINQRGNVFETFIPLHDLQIPCGWNSSFEAKNQLEISFTQKKSRNDAMQIPCGWNLFITRSNGLKTQRDAWCYNFSCSELEKNIQTTIDFYNTHEPTEIDPKKITWTRATVQNKNRGRELEFDAKKIVESMYRPFCKANLYYDRALNEMTYQVPKLFPTGDEENLLICVTAASSRGDFSVFITNKITDLAFAVDGVQCFPLYWYERSAQGNLFGENLTRRDGVTDFILRRAQENYGSRVTREDIFYYVYGFLHLPAYREKFSAELKKSLPRIFLVDDAQIFWQLSKAGRELAAVHLNYENQPPPAGVEVIGAEKNNFAVTKLRFASKDDRTTLIYNSDVTIKNIPPRSFEYVVNGRSPLEWIIDRYQVKTDKDSGIVNDPNAWATEHDKPRYILDLILSCLTVSLKTLDIVDGLPQVEFGA